MEVGQVGNPALEYSALKPCYEYNPLIHDHGVLFFSNFQVHSPRAVEVTSGFLRNYATSDVYRTDAVRKDAVEALTKGFVEHNGHPSVVYWVCGALNNLGRNPECKSRLQSCGVLDCCEVAMRTFPQGTRAYAAATELFDRIKQGAKK